MDRISLAIPAPPDSSRFSYGGLPTTRSGASPSGRVAMVPALSPSPRAAALPAAWRSMSGGSDNGPLSLVMLVPPDVCRKGGEEIDNVGGSPAGIEPSWSDLEPYFLSL